MNEREAFYSELIAAEEMKTDQIRDQKQDALVLIEDLRGQIADLKREISLRDHVIRTCAEMFDGADFPRTAKWLREFAEHGHIQS